MEKRLKWWLTQRSLSSDWHLSSRRLRLDKLLTLEFIKEKLRKDRISLIQVLERRLRSREWSGCTLPRWLISMKQELEIFLLCLELIVLQERRSVIKMWISKWRQCMFLTLLYLWLLSPKRWKISITFWKLWRDFKERILHSQSPLMRSQRKLLSQVWVNSICLFIVKDSRENTMLIWWLEILQLITGRLLVAKVNSSTLTRSNLEVLGNTLRLLGTLSQSMRISLLLMQIWAMFSKMLQRDKIFLTSMCLLLRRRSMSGARKDQRLDILSLVWGTFCKMEKLTSLIQVLWRSRSQPNILVLWLTKLQHPKF